MGYKTINAVDILAQFESRPRDYSKIADHLCAAARLTGLAQLAHIAQRIRRDSRADALLLAMVKLSLMGLPRPLELALFDDVGQLHEQLTPLMSNDRT